MIHALKNALGVGRKKAIPVRVELRDGLYFIDEVIEVMQAGSADAAVAVFKNNPQVVLSEIQAVTVVTA